jgi:hypothetical protein
LNIIQLCLQGVNYVYEKKDIPLLNTILKFIVKLTNFPAKRTKLIIYPLDGEVGAELMNTYVHPFFLSILNEIKNISNTMID